MKQIFFIVAIFVMLLSSCDEMNSLHQPYLDRGETIYTGAVDSLKAFGGNNRVKLKWQMNADPRVSNLIIRWNNRKDSLNLPVIRTAETVGIFMDSILLQENLEEGMNMFEFYTIDGKGNTSIVKEVSTEVYGLNFASAAALRAPRKITTIEALTTTMVKVIFNAVDESDLKETQLRYISYENNESGEFQSIEVENTTESVILEHVKLGDPVYYQSRFLPDKDALDGFNGKEFTYQIPKMILPPSGNYDILDDSWCDYWGKNDMSGGSTVIDIATGEFAQGNGSNCFTTKMALESYANWKLGLKINPDYSIHVYVAKFNGDWASKFKFCNYDPEKCYFDPVLKIIHFNFDIEVEGAWRIRGEYHIKPEN